VRFKFDPKKSDMLRKNPKRSIGFEEAQEIWMHPYYLDTRSDLPEQYRAIGWVRGTPLFCDFRNSRRWRTRVPPSDHFMERLQGRNRSFMKRTPKGGKPISADSIAKRAEHGEDVSRYFNNSGRMMAPVQRVNVDFTQEMRRKNGLKLQGRYHAKAA
jgi:hypothetical protein